MKEFNNIKLNNIWQVWGIEITHTDFSCFK